MATARIRFRSGRRGKFGWIDYDDQTKAIEVDHPEQEVHTKILRFFEEGHTVRVPVEIPEDLAAAGAQVTDYTDDEVVTGFDDMGFFLRRANELASIEIDVFWKASTVPEGF